MSTYNSTLSTKLVNIVLILCSLIVTYLVVVIIVGAMIIICDMNEYRRVIKEFKVLCTIMTLWFHHSYCFVFIESIPG